MFFRKKLPHGRRRSKPRRIAGAYAERFFDTLLGRASAGPLPAGIEEEGAIPPD